MDELSEIPVELQIAKGLDQIQQHSTRLAEIQRKISAQASSSASTGTVAWDTDLALSWDRFEDSIQLHMAPEEKVDVNDLVRTDNDLLNRVMVVFAYLCDEAKWLEKTAEETFYGPLLVFGEVSYSYATHLHRLIEEKNETPPPTKTTTTWHLLILLLFSI